MRTLQQNAYLLLYQLLMLAVASTRDPLPTGNLRATRTFTDVGKTLPIDETRSEDRAFEPDGMINADFNTAYVTFEEFTSGPALIVSSFHNVALNPHAMSMPGNATGVPPFIPFEDDLVALVTDLDAEHPLVTRLSPKNASIRTTWPNEAQRAPDGVFPFEAVVVPQGWFAQAAPGQLVAFDVHTDRVVVIHQSTPDKPRFYHSIVFVDMNQDGMLDILTVRSGYKLIPSLYPPVGELVWFENPGLEPMMLAGDNMFVWKEHILVDGIGPDVFVDAKDMDGDGVPEIVATHLFAGFQQFVGTDWESNSSVTLYGAPEGEDWTAVDLSSSASIGYPRVADIVVDQGYMFSVEIVDLDGDGRLDVLTTNHQSLIDPIDGRVLGVEPPASGLLFADAWTVHLLMGDIRPTVKPQPALPPQRLAPGAAKSFRGLSAEDRRWIVVSGDQASKAWVLKATPQPWLYESELLFDIDEFYGENTTQTILEDPYGIIISSIGSIGVREEEDQIILYVPVFEATDIHVFRSAGDTLDDTESFSPDEDSAVSSAVSLRSCWCQLAYSFLDA
jgi:hypothetical protein